MKRGKQADVTALDSNTEELLDTELDEHLRVQPTPEERLDAALDAIATDPELMPVLMAHKSGQVAALQAEYMRGRLDAIGEVLYQWRELPDYLRLQRAQLDVINDPEARLIQLGRIMELEDTIEGLSKRRQLDLEHLESLGGSYEPTINGKPVDL